MTTAYNNDKVFDGTSIQGQQLEGTEFECCTFTHCDLSGVSLSDAKFADCTFIQCNLSLVTLRNTAFRNCTFEGCKLLGIAFEHCNRLGLSMTFRECMLNHASFHGIGMKKTRFQDSQLLEVDFSEADLAGAVFDGCDLSLARFEHTNLEQADFRTAFRYTIHPAINKMRKARFSADGALGLLAAFDITIE